MSFYLGIWDSPNAISDDEAARRFRALSDGTSARPKFEGRVYAFYQRLTDLYPEIEMLPEDELDDSPWDCGIDMSGGHVIMAIQPGKSEKIVSEVVTLAQQYELVCFDPQAGRVYLPPRLRAGRGRTASGTA